MASFNFNADSVAPSVGFEPIPAGKYPAIIEASEIKPTQAGTGKRLNLTFSILGGEFANRKIFEGLNIENPNADAQRISLENLSAICHAIGVKNLTNTEQLHNKPLTINVKIKAASGDYDARNVIKGYEAANGSGASGGGAQRPAGGAQRPAPANTGGQRPAPQGRPAQQAPAQRGPAPQAQGGRPAGAQQPLRQQAPAQQPVQEAQPSYVDADQQDYADQSGGYGNDGGEFDSNSGAGDAPWDN